MGNDSKHKMGSSIDTQRWNILAVLLGILAFILIFVACTPTQTSRDVSGTRIAEKRRDATVVARAVSNIQATNTTKENEATCLAQPTKCQSLGLDWLRTVEKCRDAGGLSNCYPPRTQETPRVSPRRVIPAHVGECETAAGVRRPCVIPQQIIPQRP